MQNIDVLIYAHDGRGLGHVSRSIGIGLAILKYFPNTSVLFLTGSRTVESLLDGAGLDWIKIPAYKTKITDGVSSGDKSFSNIEDSILGELRADTIKAIFKCYRPKVFLSDHTPQGKHKELLPALQSGASTINILGIRAVVGDVGKVWSDFSADIFRKYYSHILWYGDAKVCGNEELLKLESLYGVKPHKTGYVSRFRELSFSENISDTIAGVIAIPWNSEGSNFFLQELVKALSRFDSKEGVWNIHIDTRGGNFEVIKDLFSDLSNVSIKNVGAEFLKNLNKARSAIVYGGYNSLTDVLVAKTPSIVLLRGMKDGEQEEHVEKIAKYSPIIVDFMSDTKACEDRIYTSLRKCLKLGKHQSNIKIDGAKKSASYIVSLVEGE